MADWGFGISLPGILAAMIDQSFTWRGIADLALRAKSQLLQAQIIAVFAALAAVPIPLMMPLLVDEVLLERPSTMVNLIDRVFPASWQGPLLYILVVLCIALSLRLLSAALGVWQAHKFAKISKSVIYALRERLLRRMQRVSMAEYESLGSGAISSHFVTDMNAIDEFVGSSISKFLVAALTLIGAATILLVMHWQLALFIILLNPAVIYATVLMGKKVKRLKQRENKAFELFQQALTETLEAILQVRAANREAHYFARLGKLAREVRDSARAYAWKSDTATRLSTLIFLAGWEVFRAVSMLMVVFSDLSIGEMMAVFGYLWFMMGPVQEVLAIQYSWFAAKAALERINQLQELDDEPDYPHNTNPFAGVKTVAVDVDQLCFRYAGGPLILDHLSLHIPAGLKVALVGASGGGKSTFVQALMGLYVPESGRIRFNGQDVSQIGLDCVRDHVTVVLQHPALFNDSVRNNLGLGRQLEDAELWQALELAQLADDIRALPNGLDTDVGRQGVRLSGGQRQRLAIARMVLANPSVVILDESTSALDTETESRLHKALQTFLDGRTTIIVAHRLSAVRQADRVYVFESGQIIEEGHHDELIANAGLYAKLYSEQV